MEYAQVCSDSGWPDGAKWDITFDPLSVSFFTVEGYYQHKYPFANPNSEKHLYLFRNMSHRDIEGEIAAATKFWKHPTPAADLELWLHGFDEDAPGNLEYSRSSEDSDSLLGGGRR